MARQLQTTCNFKSINLRKDQVLGIGSYGKVCKAECDDLLCAAKIIHETLVAAESGTELTQQSLGMPVTRFLQECEFLSTIRHPNIVQYLCTTTDPDSKNLPVLLMELMDMSLTHFLESSPTISYHVQVKICHDIVLALSFLHQNNIIHRDLSSNNVLLIGNVSRAKVTDFGMARMIHDPRQSSQLSFTQCPGAEVFMPPEAVLEHPKYTEKIDSFSFGVIVVQIITQKFPKPGNRYVKVNDPNYPAPIHMTVPEIDRRKNHIQEIDPDHPLLPIALDCLVDDDIKRPSAQQLCKKIVSLRTLALDTDSFSKEMSFSVQISSPNEEMDTEATLKRNTEQISHLKKIITEKDKVIEDSLLEIQKLKQELNKQRKMLGHHQSQAGNDGTVIEKSRQNDNSPTYSNSHKNGFELRWKECDRAPCEMVRWVEATVHGNLVYFKCGFTIYAYNATLKSWSQINLDCPRDGCPIAVINDLLTTIGGFRGTNELFSLTGEGRNMAWSQEFPPMPTRRCWSTALCTGKILIVAGGKWRREILRVVEVMNTETHQWYTATPLPEPLLFFSAAVCGESIFILGGENEDQKPSRVVYTCSHDTLIQSSRPFGPHNGRLPNQPHSDRASKICSWERRADLPVTESTSLSFHHKLLTVGGRDSNDKPTTAIHLYDPSSDCWKMTSSMALGRYYCFVAALSDNSLMVVGGYTAMNDRIEIGSLVVDDHHDSMTEN